MDFPFLQRQRSRSSARIGGSSCQLTAPVAKQTRNGKSKTETRSALFLDQGLAILRPSGRVKRDLHHLLDDSDIRPGYDASTRSGLSGRFAIARFSVITARSAQ